ncbi:Pectinesterase 2 [Dichanthelium oligosanthes]|uniref:Pectinesterase n=1 Tax=Dichanthelium oligosanthes TaxID=888268 RepID=A0A1E5VVG8_9POAL|nr:Pectinesterase 2 [Dichanthelium oligosanthes]
MGHLNRTATAVASGSESDTLAWLSAARTCLDTCLTGFRELGTSPGPEFQAVLANASRDVTNAIEATARRRRDTTKHNTTRTRTDVDTSQGCLRRPDGDGVALRQGRRPVHTPADADLVVAKDGTGNFCTVEEALEAAARRSDGGRVVVYVKAGVYDEHVEVWTSNLVLLGDGTGRTVITGNRSVQGGYTTFSSATFAVNADGFVACGVTFRNTAGAGAQQAVAMRATADRVAFYRCGFEGHQDTLYAHVLRHFYRECAVAGTVDFVFGDAAAVLQRCSLRVRRPLLPGQPAVVTAQGRADRHERTGFAVHGGRVSASAKFASGGAPFGTFLGRPWKEFSRVVYMEAYMDGTVDAAGWLPWGGTECGQDTAFYGEYRNTGPGSGTSGRVPRDHRPRRGVGVHRRCVGGRRLVAGFHRHSLHFRTLTEYSKRGLNKPIDN